MEESEHVTPCGRLMLRCDGFNFTLVDLSTGVIASMGYDPLNVMRFFDNPMDAKHKELLAEWVDDDVDRAVRVYITEDNGYEF